MTADHTLFDQDLLHERATLFDVDLQHATSVGGQAVVWGAGYRRYRSAVRAPDFPDCGSCFGYSPLVDRNETYSAFVNLPWQLRDDLRLVVGSKVERSVWAGWQFQPTLRASWQPSADQTLWAGVARPVRTPDRNDRGRAFYRLPPQQAASFGCRSYADGLCVLGNPELPAWKVRSVEAGYRLDLSGSIDIDLSAFDNRYDYGPLSPSRSRLRGGEAVLHWQPARSWRGELSLARHVGDDTLANGSRRETTLLSRTTWKLRSLWNLDARWTLDVNAAYATSMARYGQQGQTLPRLPASERINLRVGYRPQAATEIALSVLNASGGDAEVSEFFFVNTAQRRGAFLSLTHAF